MNTKQIIKKIEEGFFDARLLEIYVDNGMLEYQKKRYADAVREYEKRFGEDDVRIFSVPGRSEVAGNHTDHQHGCVMACSINLDIIIVAAYADEFRLYSNGREIEGININDLSLKMSQQHTSLALVKGVLHKLKQDGHKIGNVRAVMNSNVLVGSGLSSSAAFEVAVGAMMSFMFNDGKISKIEIAKDSQYAENVYFGKPCGLMDQCACAVGGLIFIDFKDVANPVVEKVDVNFSDFHHSLCIVDTKGSHSGLTGDYQAIPEEMKTVANYFGKDFVREITLDDIMNNLADLRKKCNDRAILRAIHMLEEDDRVFAQVKNLTNKDFASFKKLIKESGESSYKYLQNVYTNHDCTNQPMSLGIKISENVLGEHGVVRVHGGGFAGTIQAFVEDDFVEEYRKAMDALFGEGSCLVLKVNQFGACEVLG